MSGDNRIIHGMSNTRTFRIWWCMHRRCSDPSHGAYKNYGARGIQVCARWRKFAAFLEDMGEAPAGLTIDRIDNAKGYAPGNCRWATYKEQLRNTRSNRVLTHNGRTQCIAAWAEELGVHRQNLLNRLNRGWSVEETIETPFQPSARYLTLDGRTLSLKQWAAQIGVSYNTIAARVRKGWDAKRALSKPVEK